LSGSRLELSPSWIFAAAILVLHAAAAAAVFTVMPTFAGAALGTALFSLGLAAAWSRALLASRLSVSVIELSASGMTLELKNGQRLAAELAERRHVSRFMVTLPLARPVRRTVLVTRDMLEGEEFRRLRLWTLWGRLPHLDPVAAKQLHS
jgi:membrane-bound toxin of toxin-antitoxin system